MSSNLSFKKEDIIEYLKKNPAFFDEYPEVLSFFSTRLLTTHPNIKDFQYYLNVKLQKQVSLLTQSNKNFLTACDNNSFLLKNIHEITLELIQIENLSHFLNYLRDQVPHYLSIDKILICIEEQSHIHFSFKKFLLQHDIIFIDSLFFKICHSLPSIEQKLIPLLESPSYLNNQFLPDTTIRISSHAVIYMPWENINLTGGVIFASQDKKIFHPDNATDLLEFLGKIIYFKLGKLLSEHYHTIMIHQ